MEIELLKIKLESEKQRIIATPQFKHLLEVTGLPTDELLETLEGLEAKKIFVYS